MAELSPYPWQRPLWQGLLDRLRDGRLPHALLLSGPAGMGKQEFASRFSRAILCDSPNEDGSACGQCRGCQLMQAGSHPDYLLVAPEEEGKAIGIDAVRELARFQALKSQYGRQRVIQLQPADALNPNSANALLKTLEEPAGDTILLLTTDRPMALLPTIRSRCQKIIFRPMATPTEEILCRNPAGDGRWGTVTGHRPGTGGDSGGTGGVAGRFHRAGAGQGQPGGAG